MLVKPLLVALFSTTTLAACASAVMPHAVDAGTDTALGTVDGRDAPDVPSSHPTPCHPAGMACGDRDWCCGGYCDRSDGGPGTCQPVPAGTFPCGSTYCAFGSEYCELVYSDVSTPDSSTCRPVPGACDGALNCGCVAQSCAMSCTMSDANTIVLQCAGG